MFWLAPPLFWDLSGLLVGYAPQLQLWHIMMVCWKMPGWNFSTLDRNARFHSQNGSKPGSPQYLTVIYRFHGQKTYKKIVFCWRKKLRKFIEISDGFRRFWPGQRWLLNPWCWWIPRAVSSATERQLGRRKWLSCCPPVTSHRLGKWMKVGELGFTSCKWFEWWNSVAMLNY